MMSLFILPSYAWGNKQENPNANQDKGKEIFENDKPKKQKVKPVKQKAQYKVTDKVKNEYKIPTDIYMSVGDDSDKTYKLTGGVEKSAKRVYIKPTDARRVFFIHKIGIEGVLWHRKRKSSRSLPSKARKSNCRWSSAAKVKKASTSPDCDATLPA